MTAIVQLCGCMETEDGVAPFVSNNLSDFYGVYVGQPGEFVWHADFLYYQDALTYASAMASAHGLLLQDITHSDGDSNDTHH